MPAINQRRSNNRFDAELESSGPVVSLTFPPGRADVAFAADVLAGDVGFVGDVAFAADAVLAAGARDVRLVGFLRFPLAIRR
jgi:hypothetical protein